jgi:hypothetical protein
LRSYFVRFVRAGGRCEWCGAEHGRAHPVTGSTVVLTTAHVHDDRPEAASLLNLAALCQRCDPASASLDGLRISLHDNPARRAGAKARALAAAGQGDLFGGLAWASTSRRKRSPSCARRSNKGRHNADFLSLF